MQVKVISNSDQVAFEQELADLLKKWHINGGRLRHQDYQIYYSTTHAIRIYRVDGRNESRDEILHSALVLLP